MDIIDLRLWGGHPVDAYGSQGLTAEIVARTEAAQVTVLRVSEGGLIGRHTADTDQLLLVVSGRGSVQGEDGAWRPIGPGRLALWKAGEAHATHADSDLTAYVIESPGLLART